MAATSDWSTAIRNTMMDAVAAVCDGAFLDAYTGADPGADNAATGTKLARWTLATPGFGASAAGVITANAIAGVTCLADGTAAYFRLIQSDDTTVVCDGNIGTATSCLIFDAVSFVTGATVNITSFTLSANEVGA